MLAIVTRLLYHSCMQLRKIEFKQLNARQKENYNFQKIAAVLAEYGYSCMWLNDDWLGADFIAVHIDGNAFLKVQLKARFSINRKYEGKDIYMAFRSDDKTYLYPHDKVRDEMFTLFPKKLEIASWVEDGNLNWPNPAPAKIQSLLTKYEI